MALQMNVTARLGWSGERQGWLTLTIKNHQHSRQADKSPFEHVTGAVFHKQVWSVQIPRATEETETAL